MSHSESGSPLPEVAAVRKGGGGKKEGSGGKIISLDEARTKKGKGGGTGGDGGGGEQREKLPSVAAVLIELKALGFELFGQENTLLAEKRINVFKTEDGRNGLLINFGTEVKSSGRFKLGQEVKVPRGTEKAVKSDDRWIIAAFGKEVVPTSDWHGYEVRLIAIVKEFPQNLIKSVPLIELQSFNPRPSP